MKGAEGSGRKGGKNGGQGSDERSRLTWISTTCSPGRLDHGELVVFVNSIPDLSADERKFIVAYLYQADSNADGLLR
jgi:hypothetical protein